MRLCSGWVNVAGHVLSQTQGSNAERQQSVLEVSWLLCGVRARLSHLSSDGKTNICAWCRPLIQWVISKPKKMFLLPSVLLASLTLLPSSLAWGLAQCLVLSSVSFSLSFLLLPPSFLSSFFISLFFSSFLPFNQSNKNKLYWKCL
jgi:hypothetical protein